MCRNLRAGAGALALGASLLVPAVIAEETQEPTAPRWTLEDALSHAVSEHPEIRSACATRSVAEADVLDARVFPHNPEIELEGADRRGATDSTRDRGVTLSQRLEIGGQRGRRVDAARSVLAEADAGLLRRLREHRAHVERAFVEALAARERLRVAEADLELTRELLTFERKRLDAGAGTALDVRLAETAVGRATREMQQTRAELESARARLARAAGWEAIRAPQPTGDFEPPRHFLAHRDALVAQALEARGDLTALDRRRETARRRLELERSLRIPDLTISAFTAREEGDDVTGLGLGISIPLFDRNQGGVARAEREIAQADARHAGAELEIRHRVAAAVARHDAAVRAFEVLDDLVVENLEETLGLLETAFREGEVSATEVLVLRRELVDGRREHVEAARDLWLARIELEETTGTLEVPPVEEVCHAME